MRNDVTKQTPAQRARLPDPNYMPVQDFARHQTSDIS